MQQQPAPIVSSDGLQITDAAQQKATDMVAAFSSSLGHRHPEIIRAITAACQSHLGSDQDLATASLADQLGEPFSAFADICLVPSASEANESAIRIARVVGGCQGGNGAGAGTARYRIITLLGGNHGDTLACRSASGRIADQVSGGPLMAGFRHIAPGDVRALNKAVDETTAAVLLAPVDWGRGGEPFDADYLLEVRRLCDATGTLLILDETQLPAAISGHWFFHQAHGLRADMVTAAAGWTGGLPGGLVLLSEAVSGRLSGASDSRDADASKRQIAPPGARAGESGGMFSRRKAGQLSDRDYPVLRAIVQSTAAAVRELGGPDHVGQLVPRWAELWQEVASGFEFVREVTTHGMWAVVQLDLPAAEVAAAAGKLGLRLLSSGETTLLACLPVTVTAEEMAPMLGTFRAALETMERQTIES